MAEIDHIVLGARSLEEGAAFIRQHLGVEPQPGGRHEGYGTHNMLVGLGRDCYLEIIAADPDQPEPSHPRLFDLDDPGTRMMLESEPRLLAWVARTPVLDAVFARLGPRAGEMREMRRGELRWRIAFPPQRQDMENLIPALIQWQREGAAGGIPDSGCRLVSLEAEHPEAEAVRAALAERGLEEAMRVRRSPHARLVARIHRPDGSEVAFTSA
jgi:hypothetical protein